MRNPAKAILLTGLCLLLAIDVHADPLREKVDQVFAAWNRADSPGLALVVVQDGAVAYQRGYGCADLEHAIPNTTQTVFDVASVAKQFTGLAIAMLVEQEKLSLNDEVRQHLPEVPEFGKPITIAHLLHHTSGLRDWPETFALSGKDMGDLITMNMILEMVRRQHDLDFMPGERHLYSNSGYNLLAAVIEKVTGQSFRAWMNANIFAPLGMDHTHVQDDPAEVVLNHALPYRPAGRKDVWSRLSNRLAAPGSSSLFTTAEDLAKWLINLETGKVGGKSAIEAMLQGSRLNDGTRVNYGFGLGVKQYRGMKAVEHSGGWAGYRSDVLHLPEKRFAVAILGNASNINASDLARKVAGIYLDLPPESAPIKPVPAAELIPVGGPEPAQSQWDSYLGTYRLGPGWLLTISREGRQLLAQATREAKHAMTPLSDRRFFVDAYGATVEFVRDESRPVTHLLYKGINAPKLRLPETTAEYLRAYVGDYWSDELCVVYRLAIREGQLQTWHPAGRWIDLLPTAADQFDSDARFSFEFTRNAEGNVNGMSVSGSRVRAIRFVRISLPETKLPPP